MSRDKIVIVGRAGSGKTTLAKDLESKKFNLAKLHTSRKKRNDSESEYHFTDNEFFYKNKDSFIFIETFTDSEIKKYGLTRAEFEKSNTVILVPEYFAFFTKEEISEMIIFYLDTPRSECIRRQLARGDKEETVARRAKNDDAAFSDLFSRLKEMKPKSLFILR